MQTDRRYQILVFEDSVGVSSGYKGIWKELLEKTGLGEKVARVIIRSAYRTFPKGRLLEWRKGKKQPRFNSNSSNQLQTRLWVEQVIKQHTPDLVICFDPALLFLLNPIWDQASLDILRGGVYIHMDVPWVVTLPITAHHNKAKAKDIAKLNEGYVEKGDFEEYRAALPNDDDSEDDEDTGFDDDDESRMEWHEPIVVPYGRLVLKFDFEKAARLMNRIPK